MTVQSIERDIEDAAQPNRVHFTMSALAAVLAAYGLLTNRHRHRGRRRGSLRHW
jgi:hypothetical protein